MPMLVATDMSLNELEQTSGNTTGLYHVNADFRPSSKEIATKLTAAQSVDIPSQLSQSMMNSNQNTAELENVKYGDGGCGGDARKSEDEVNVCLSQSSSILQQMGQKFDDEVHEPDQTELKRTNDAVNLDKIVFQACRKKTHYHNSGGIRHCTDESCELYQHRPNSTKYQDESKRLTTLQNVHFNITERKIIAKSGYYLKGKWLKCFSCGDKLRLNLVKPETLNVDHAREAPYCSRMREVMGDNFIRAVIEIEKRVIPFPSTDLLLSICQMYDETSREETSLEHEITHLRQFLCPDLINGISNNTEEENLMLSNSDDNTEIQTGVPSDVISDNHYIPSFNQLSMPSLEQEPSNLHQVTSDEARIHESMLTNVSPYHLQSQHEIATRRIVEAYESSNQNQIPIYLQLGEINGVNQGNCDVISNPNYARFQDRLHSFYETALLVSNPYLLALSGFYYLGYSDCIQCFFCGGCLWCLSSRSVASILHAKYYPNCYYNYSLLGAEYVNYYHALPLLVVLDYDDYTATPMTYTSNFEERADHFNSLIACKKCLTRKISLHFFHPPYEPGYISLCLNCGQGFMQCYCSRPSHSFEMSII